MYRYVSITIFPGNGVTTYYTLSTSLCWEVVRNIDFTNTGFYPTELHSYLVSHLWRFSASDANKSNKECGEQISLLWPAVTAPRGR
jgi:hypothetical protein